MGPPCCVPLKQKWELWNGGITERRIKNRPKSKKDAMAESLSLTSNFILIYPAEFAQI